MNDPVIGSAGAAATSRPLSRWRRSVLMSGALLSGIIVGAGGLALAATAPYGQARQGHRLERMQHVVLSALDAVGATTAQEAKIHDIIATTFADQGQDGQARRALHQQMIELLRAPTVDRAAVERVRADEVATFDAKSKTMVTALLDAADQLTPEQRGKLADRAEGMMQRHAMGGLWGGQRGGWMNGHRHPPAGGEPGPGDGPDDGPTKG